MGLPCKDDSGTVARAIQADILVLRPAVTGLCGWTKAGPRSYGGMWATSMRRMA